MSKDEKYALIKSVGILALATVSAWFYTDMVFDYANRRIDSYFEE